MVIAFFLFKDHSSKNCSKLISGATSYYHPRNQGPVAAGSTTTTCMHALITSGGLSGRLPGNLFPRPTNNSSCGEEPGELLNSRGAVRGEG